MKFHLPSFLLGCGAGYAARALSEHLRPVLLEMATVGYRLAGAVSARTARAREDLEDILAEARARVASKDGGRTIRPVS